MTLEEQKESPNQNVLTANRPPLVFSREAQAVFDRGRKIWQYYHQQKNADINASLYDIRAYFQERNDTGHMNNKSSDEQYNILIAELRKQLLMLAKKITPKVYEHGFLLPQ